MDPRHHGGFSGMRRLTVLIADDDPLFRDALADLISSEPELELVGSAINADEAIELAGATQAAAAVIDVRMPGGGARAARAIRECSPETRIVAYSAYDDRGIVLDMLRAGATSYLLKGAPANEVISTIMRAARGEGVLSPEITGGVVDELTSHMQRTDREQDELRRLQNRVQYAIDERRFESVFQPIVELATGRIVGVEALSRFSDEPLQGPDRWFADADRAGLRAELELATARAAITRLGDLAPSLYMSVNLSPETLPRCRSLFDQDSATRLVIEITEHAAIDDYETLNSQLETFRIGGTRLAVDDAGAGFASLRHTLRLAPDFIKLDISLTKGIDRDRGLRALAAGLIGFAHELNADITAEGIETHNELDTLRALGVRLGQGYYLAVPGPLPLETDELLLDT
jgi:EAL domain-containing protein (putative c-di-GMP-specific phosphodiesterase class I)/DNA-binding NarL/FixJ family response regulator